MSGLQRALAEALDKHWLESSIAQGFVRCSCGEWRQDIPDGLTVPMLGEHFQPFSDHCATASLADPAFREALTREVAEALDSEAVTNVIEPLESDEDVRLVAAAIVARLTAPEEAT